MVKATPFHSNVVAPIDGSNNTGEMRAVIELFDYILHYSALPQASELRIFIDSQYVIRSLLGDQPPSTHHQLVELALQYFTALRTQHFVVLIQVSSHIGILGNEIADTLARRGVSSYGSLGRFSLPQNPASFPSSCGIQLPLVAV